MTAAGSLERWSARSDDEREQLAARLTAELGPGWDARGLREWRCGDQRHTLAGWRHPRTGLDFHLIPGGAHRVYEGFISEDAAARTVGPFLLATEPVSQALWDRVLEGEADSDARSRRDPELPIDGITQAGVARFLERLGDGLRLPSAQEWDHAAWSGAGTRFPWGPDPDPRCQWSADNAAGETRPAALHRDVPNAFGLIDMIGNIWELCGDGLASGGCCASHPYAMDLRAELPAPGRPAFIGLRLARSVPEALFDHA